MLLFIYLVIAVLMFIGYCHVQVPDLRDALGYLILSALWPVTLVVLVYFALTGE